MMKAIETTISGVKIIIPTVFNDDRGYFLESFHADQMASLIDGKYNFVQDNHSHSKKNVLRGLHYQIRQPQGKLVRVVRGEIYDVAVDLRKSSPTFGQCVGSLLSSENKQMIWIPPHFAHGFLVLSESADVIYKTTDYYSPTQERCLRWDDPDLAIEWPTNQPVILSSKDRQGGFLKDAEIFP
jgi:dTDP-4-dehydrorhamnose 3,5-epimerase